MLTYIEAVQASSEPPLKLLRLPEEWGDAGGHEKWLQRLFPGGNLTEKVALAEVQYCVLYQIWYSVACVVQYMRSQCHTYCLGISVCPVDEVRYMCPSALPNAALSENRLSVSL